MTQKADYVYALFLFHDEQMQLLVEHESGFWTLFGGSVLPDETEQDALRRHVLEQWHCEGEVSVLDQVGPLHELPAGNGKTAKAFRCYATSQSGLTADEFVGVTPFAQDEMMIELGTPVIERMIWDGFSIMKDPTVLPKRTDNEVEGIHLHPNGRVLVEEKKGERREWARLDPM